jgi:hypothetical protein
MGDGSGDFEWGFGGGWDGFGVEDGKIGKKRLGMEFEKRYLWIGGGRNEWVIGPIGWDKAREGRFERMTGRMMPVIREGASHYLRIVPGTYRLW